MSALDKSRGHLRSSTNVRVYAVTIRPSESVRAFETIGHGHGAIETTIHYLCSL